MTNEAPRFFQTGHPDSTPFTERERNSKLAILVQGQGSQKVGMGLELGGSEGRSEAAKAVWSRADNTLEGILGFTLSDVCWNGPADLLNKTFVTQPAVIVDALARKATLEEMGLPVNAEWHTGSSLGLLLAAHNAGAITEDGLLRLAYKRGKAMQIACEKEKTTLAPVRGVPLEKLRELTAKYGIYICLTNIDKADDPNKLQLVIGGKVEDLQRMKEKEKLDKDMTILTVDGAFHSPYMEPAREPWRQALEEEGQEITAPTKGTLIGNTRPVPLITRVDVIQELEDQLTRTVLHADAMRYLFLHGVGDMVELGAVPILSNINKTLLGGERPERIATPSLGSDDRGVTIAQRWKAAA